MSESRTPLVHPSLAEHERQRCEVWTRVMGYHRPVSSFNIGKRGEHAERVSFATAPGSACGRTDNAPVACPA